MKINEISLSRSCKVNHGNYENTDYFISLKAELDPLDTLEDVVKNLSIKIDTIMAQQLEKVFIAKGKKVSRKDIINRYGLTWVEP